MNDEISKSLLEKYRNIWRKIKHKYIEKEYKSNIYGQGRLLKTLICHGGEMQSKELSSVLGISAPSLSELVNKCVKSEYLVKEKDSNDLRITYIKITDKGRTLIKEKENIKSDIDLKVFSCFTKEELNEFNRLLTLLEEHISN